MLAAPELDAPVHGGGEEQIAELGAALACRVEGERRHRSVVAVETLKDTRFAALRQDQIETKQPKEINSIAYHKERCRYKSFA